MADVRRQEGRRNRRAVARVEVGPKGELKVHPVLLAFAWRRVVDRDAVAAQAQ